MTTIIDQADRVLCGFDMCCKVVNLVAVFSVLHELLQLPFVSTMYLITRSCGVLCVALMGRHARCSLCRMLFGAF